MHDPLGDALAVEAGQLLDQVLVLEEDRPAGPAVWERWLSATGAPDSVVRVSFAMPLTLRPSRFISLRELSYENDKLFLWNGPRCSRLTYLVAVDDHRHFGKAAEACFVSQPAFTSQIRELERRLGVTLFERGNRRVLPTSVGTIVIERARGVLRDMDELVVAARLDPAQLRGPMALG